MSATNPLAPDPDELAQWFEELMRSSVPETKWPSRARIQSKSHSYIKRTNLYNVRRKRRLTQIELAKQIRSTQDTISEIENGRREPSVYVALMIANVLETPIDELFALQVARSDDGKDFWTAVKDRKSPLG